MKRQPAALDIAVCPRAGRGGVQRREGTWPHPPFLPGMGQRAVHLSLQPPRVWRHAPSALGKGDLEVITLYCSPAENSTVDTAGFLQPTPGVFLMRPLVVTFFQVVGLLLGRKEGGQRATGSSPQDARFSALLGDFPSSKT